MLVAKMAAAAPHQHAVLDEVVHQPDGLARRPWMRSGRSAPPRWVASSSGRACGIAWAMRRAAWPNGDGLPGPRS